MVSVISGCYFFTGVRTVHCSGMLLRLQPALPLFVSSRDMTTWLRLKLFYSVGFAAAITPGLRSCEWDGASVLWTKPTNIFDPIAIKGMR